MQPFSSLAVFNKTLLRFLKFAVIQDTRPTAVEWILVTDLLLQRLGLIKNNFQ